MLTVSNNAARRDVPAERAQQRAHLGQVPPQQALHFGLFHLFLLMRARPHITTHVGVRQADQQQA
jgi:hypothetical protein